MKHFSSFDYYERKHITTTATSSSTTTTTDVCFIHGVSYVIAIVIVIVVGKVLKVVLVLCFNTFIYYPR